MNAPVPISDLFRVLLPRDHPNGWLGMLTGYFDDSGTHESARIVLLGGLCGTEWQLTSLHKLWAKLINDPLGQKPRLNRFHAYDCQNSIGEFIGWTRTETDYFWHLLQTAIIDSGVTPYGIACVRSDWDALITGDTRGIYGNAEQMCIRNCFVKALDWAQKNTFDPQMTFVFDNRPSNIQRDAQVVSHAFENGRPGELPAVIGTAFLSSYKILPLQAADLIAWELYQFANDIYDGLATFGNPRRQQLRRMMDELHFEAQFATAESIKEIADFVAQRDPKMTKAAALHFRTFDPNPGLSPFGTERSS
jgi:hypothetical protein